MLGPCSARALPVLWGAAGCLLDAVQQVGQGFGERALVKAASSRSAWRSAAPILFLRFAVVALVDCVQDSLSALVALLHIFHGAHHTAER